MAISADYKKVIKLAKAKEVKLIILSERFWNNCSIIVRVMTQMLRLLRIYDSDEKPALGDVYEEMYTAKKGIKKLFGINKVLYRPYTKIIKDRWDKMLRKSLHAAAYWVVNGVTDMIERYNKAGSACGLTIMTQLSKFREREDTFGKSLAFASRGTTHPDEWWKLHGGCVPALQKCAIRFLSQTASSSGCERNWSVFERIHTKRRNCLEHQRLNDLVYVHYNLRLQNRVKESKRPYVRSITKALTKLIFGWSMKCPKGN